MEKPRTARRSWRSWSAVALAVATLALVQACGDSGKGTGPTSSTAVQLKLRNVNGAQFPANCKGIYDVSGPGVNINDAALPSSGQIAFAGQIGQTYVISVEVDCGLAQVSRRSLPETLTGSTSITLQPSNNVATIELTFTKVLGLTCDSPVGPNEVSHCTCTAQSAGPAVFGWQGATPTSPGKADFVNRNPGTYPVTCSVNGSEKTTNVKVEKEGTGTITVNNNEESQYTDADVSFSPGSIADINDLPAGGQAVRNNVPIGSYTATVEFFSGECSFDINFTLDPNENQVLNISTSSCP
jgi:hypothetical protein